MKLLLVLQLWSVALVSIESLSLISVEMAQFLAVNQIIQRTPARQERLVSKSGTTTITSRR